jgi:hypothetical protein
MQFAVAVCALLALARGALAGGGACPQGQPIAADVDQAFRGIDLTAVDMFSAQVTSFPALTMTCSPNRTWYNPYRNQEELVPDQAWFHTESPPLPPTILGWAAADAGSYARLTASLYDGLTYTPGMFASTTRVQQVRTATVQAAVVAG